MSGTISDVLSVVLLEDDPGDVEPFRRTLHEAYEGELELEVHDRAEDALGSLSTSHEALVFLDYMLGRTMDVINRGCRLRALVSSNSARSEHTFSSISSSCTSLTSAARLCLTTVANIFLRAIRPSSQRV